MKRRHKGASAPRKKLRQYVLQPTEDPEDADIARLGKLLGISSKDKSKAASKLSREYELYEGIGGNFGDFLMKLDDLAEGKAVFAHENDNSDDEPQEEMPLPLINDSDQEVSDIDYDYSNDGGDDDNDDNDDDDDDDDDIKSTSDGNTESLRAKNIEVKHEVNDDSYRPTEGEDIYGRSKTGKYIPPSRRVLTELDTTSEDVIFLKKTINSLLNKLSDQSKDSILREIKTIYSKNSHSILNLLIKDFVLVVCSNPAQVMTNLIPLYASFVCALHHVIGIDTGAYIIEHICLRLFNELNETKSTVDQKHLLINNKLPTNVMLILVYLYNLRILHHVLIVDILNHLVEKISHNESLDGDNLEIEIELIVCIVQNCGFQLRGDDPVSLKSMVTKMTQKISVLRKSDNSRLSYLLESLTELNSNKSKRVQNPIHSHIQDLRKWIGSVKSIRDSTSSTDACLRVTLDDLLNADKRGRWWRTSASWQRAEENASIIVTKNDSIQLLSQEEEKLNKIAKKLRFNTTTRKNIFTILMTSRDIHDAHERIIRLGLKGKQDREIILVIIECCGNEKQFNQFYVELSYILCAQNRQFKTTFLFAFWDLFKVLNEESCKERKIINSAKLLAALVNNFDLSLAVLKPMDMQEMSNNHILFLSTFFLSLLSSSISDDSFVSIFDRLSTTKDANIVREGILFFIHKYFTLATIKDEPTNKIVKQRKKTLIRILDDMKVINYVAASTDDM